ncbi:hypothetical protein [Thaumasiovibrio subtropicus]|uniref:hypothetical protein n=1 Tax=Thaumasiovibrio subtropicus TaxID=1891207 RepID=UPI000B35D1A0|nr:hypothetical protein [Thaumasiovibrio subtropicus]
MLAKLLFKTKAKVYLASLSFVVTSTVIADDLGNAAIGAALEQQAKDVGASNIGLNYKLWCGAAKSALNSNNQYQCAKYTILSVSVMSNPQPSIEAVFKNRQEKALQLLLAGDAAVYEDERVCLAGALNYNDAASCFD